MECRGLTSLVCVSTASDSERIILPASDLQIPTVSLVGLTRVSTEGGVKPPHSKDTQNGRGRQTLAPRPLELDF